MPELPTVLITLRPATLADCHRLWIWRNEPTVRESSFNTERIPYEDHEGWFSRKLVDPDTKINLVLDGHGHEVGYVRFDLHGEEAEISVCVDQLERGKGYGQSAIRVGSDQLLAGGEVRRIVAYVKVGNPSSVAAFERAGFRQIGLEEVSGIAAHKLVYAAS